MKVSVVIAGASGQRAIGNCAAAVRRISGDREIELIILPCHPAKIFQSRAQGIAQSTGERIAVLGDRYEVTPGWLEALLRSNLAVTGGCVAPGLHLDYWGWCMYLCEYAHIAPPVPEGSARDAKLVPGGNVVYSCAVVRQFPPSLARNESSFHAGLIGAAVKVGICPDLEVRFAFPPDVREYLHERLRLSYTIGSDGGIRKLPAALLLPLLLPMRIAVSVMKKRRYRWRFLVCLPAILMLGMVQAAGEFAGALGAYRKSHG